MGGMTMAAKKIPCLMPSEREAVLKLCRQEFRALQRVQHANIVKLIGVIVDDVKSVTLLMELAEGGSLRSLLTAHPEKVVACSAHSDSYCEVSRWAWPFCTARRRARFFTTT